MINQDPADRDFEAYKLLLGLWSAENPVKTLKLQWLLGVNALLVIGAVAARAWETTGWPVYLAGAVLNLVWTLSIGRTTLIQAAWHAKLDELRDRYPADPRFRVLDSAEARRRAPRLLRVLGGVSSKWYLLLAPAGFTAVWLALLVAAAV